MSRSSAGPAVMFFMVFGWGFGFLIAGWALLTPLSPEIQLPTSPSYSPPVFLFVTGSLNLLVWRHRARKVANHNPGANEDVGGKWLWYDFQTAVWIVLYFFIWLEAETVIRHNSQTLYALVVVGVYVALWLWSIYRVITMP